MPGTEASGIAGEGPEAVQALEQARAIWARLGRGLDVARCDMLLGRRLRIQDPALAEEALSRAASSYEDLGVRHLAERSRLLRQPDALKRLR